MASKEALELVEEMVSGWESQLGSEFISPMTSDSFNKARVQEQYYENLRTETITFTTNLVEEFSKFRESIRKSEDKTAIPKDKLNLTIFCKSLVLNQTP